jgi:hypothetical protein
MEMRTNHKNINQTLKLRQKILKINETMVNPENKMQQLFSAEAEWLGWGLKSVE